MRPSKIRIGQWLRYHLLLSAEHFLGFKRYIKWFSKQRSQLFTDISANFNGIELEPVNDGAESNIYADTEKVVRPGNNLPVLFKQAAAHWPCINKWSVDFFDKNYGDYEIVLNDNVGVVDPDNPQEFESIKLSQYLNLLRNGSKKYLKFSSLVNEKEELQNDLDVSWLKKFIARFSFGKVYYLFIGGEGTITPLHNEFPSVVYVQVSGKKKWIIYSPEDRIFLDPRAERRNYFYTKANPADLADPKYPLIKYAHRYEVTLEPGDVLWFPPFAWHHVENLTESIAVAFKFANIQSSFRSTKVLTTLFFMATRPSVFVDFLASRLSKKDYVLTKKNENVN